MAIVTPVGPTVRIIMPPTESVVRVVTLPEPLASDVRRHYDELAADHLRYGFKHVSFDEWVESVFRDRVYGNRALWLDEQR